MGGRRGRRGRLSGAVVEAAVVWRRPYDYGSRINAAAFEAEASARLEEAISDAVEEPRRLDITRLVLEGDPTQVLCDRSGGVDMIVLGARGHSGLAGHVLGSVTSKCATHSKCPLIIVPRQASHAGSYAPRASE